MLKKLRPYLLTANEYDICPVNWAYPHKKSNKVSGLSYMGVRGHIRK